MEWWSIGVWEIPSFQYSTTPILHLFMYYSKQNLNFLLYNVHQVEGLLNYPYYADHDKDTFDMILATAEEIADTMFLPYHTVMDREQPELENGTIKVHPVIRQIMKKFGEDGWIAAHYTYDEGGQQLPLMIVNAATFIFGAANYSPSIFPYLSTGAGNLIRTFGSQILKDTYLPKMFGGEWQGTMALTEPNAGSSLSDIETIATPTKSGYHLIKGTKIFISAGDHDGVDNVVHLMLAKIKGGPRGAKGISLFVVPKKRLDEVGNLVSNDVTTAGVYHKMGYKGAPIAHLTMGESDDCRGFLVGEPHQGLKYMFQMMNEARVGVGMSAVSIASAAYYASLEYAQKRPQGRIISDKNPRKPQVPIIQHADVKRMLLFQKSVVEGSLSLLLECSKYSDIIANTTDAEEKNKYHLLLELLTPIAKSYPSEMGCLTTSAAVQILGGSGYVQDYPVEQFYREARIHPIHEGTTGIHGLDLLGRKVMMKNGQAFQLFVKEIATTIQIANEHKKLQSTAKSLTSYLGHFTKITQYLIGLARSQKADVFLADATLYLEAFGILAIGWQWLKQGISAMTAYEAGGLSIEELRFYKSKLFTMSYFYEYEMAKLRYLMARLQSENRVTLDMEENLLV